MSFSYLALLLSCLALANAANTCDVFDPTEATIDSIHALLYSMTSTKATCRQIVQGYLAKINALNGRVNAIITLNPQALAIADAKDAQIQAGTATGDLFCIPVLLKDNYDTMDMPTTGASISLQGSQPSKGDNIYVHIHICVYIYIYSYMYICIHAYTYKYLSHLKIIILRIYLSIYR
jgi:hypothetical protein